MRVLKIPETNEEFVAALYCGCMCVYMSTSGMLVL
jgi:hypothetical protein